MPPRRRAPAPTPIDVEAVRGKLAEGKIVRVGISRSAQFPDGGTGRVRSVGDPAVDGEEFVQVEVSLNGTRDILPFTPADLTPATRTKPAAATPTPVVPPKAPPSPTSRPVVGSAGSARSVVTGPDPTRPVVGSAALAKSVVNGPERIRPVMTQPVVTRPQVSGPITDGPVVDAALFPSIAATPPTPAAAPHPDTPGISNRKVPRGTRKSAPVSITIATTETDPTHWKIEARVGARVVLRSGSVSPARVWELVRQLDDPTLINAVGGILDEQRKAAQARADALAAELALVRAELDALPDGRQ